MIKLHAINPPASEAKFLGDEPTWEDIDVTDENYKKEILIGLNWHGYCASDKNYRKYLEEWIRFHHPSDSKNEISSMKSVKKINPTFASLARMHLRNFPLKDRDISYIEDYINSFSTNKKKPVRKASAPKISVQDSMKNQLEPVFSEIDFIVDEMFAGRIETDAKKLVNDVMSKSDDIKAPHVRLIIKYIEETYLNEWNMAYNQEDEDLVEGYSFLSRRNFKKIIDIFNDISENFSKQITAAKTQRIRKKNPLDKKKMASKLRYMDEFEGIKSKLPVDIIGANVVWVYNTKTRKLGYYKSEVKNSLYVKNNKIMGFKETCEKILRKPEEQLQEILKLRKNQTVSWFDDIRAKCKEMSGRMTNETIILRIDS
jgi:hypothetical protein